MGTPFFTQETCPREGKTTKVKKINMGRVREDRPKKEMVARGVREHRVWDMSTCEGARWARVEKLAGAVRSERSERYSDTEKNGQAKGEPARC